MDATDIELLIDRIHIDYAKTGGSLPDAAFDINGDHGINPEDLRAWVQDVKHTWFGDANLDGEFNSGDLVQAFEAGQYEDVQFFNSTWSTGDWDADGDYTSTDLITALADGGYEQGPRAAVSAVPEPASFTMLVTSWAVIAIRRRRVGP